MTFQVVCGNIFIDWRDKSCFYDLFDVNLEEAVNCELQYNISAADGSSHNKTLQNNVLSESLFFSESSYLSDWYHSFKRL